MAENTRRTKILTCSPMLLPPIPSGRQSLGVCPRPAVQISESQAQHPSASSPPGQTRVSAGWTPAPAGLCLPPHQAFLGLGSLVCQEPHIPLKKADTGVWERWFATRSWDTWGKGELLKRANSRGSSEFFRDPAGCASESSGCGMKAWLMGPPSGISIQRSLGRTSASMSSFVQNSPRGCDVQRGSRTSGPCEPAAFSPGSFPACLLP